MINKGNLRHVQQKIAFARSFPCFYRIGAILNCTVRSGALLREQKCYLITNSNFWQNIGQQEGAFYSLQPIVARNKYLFDNFRQ